MVTVAGTVSLGVLFEESDTTVSAGSVPEIVTVPVPVPPSVNVAGSDSSRFVFSLSCTAMVAEASVQFAMCAVIVAECVPLIFVSSMTVITKFAEVCPAGMTMKGGTWIAVESLEVRLTATSAPAGALIVTVPVCGSAPSVTVAGAESDSTAVSLSFTAIVREPSE